MPFATRRAYVLLVATLCAGSTAFAQSVVSAQSGLVHHVEGKVLLDGKAAETRFARFQQMKEKSVLETGLGRAEVLLTPGVFMRVGENTSVRMLSTLLSDSRVELISGSVAVEGAELGKECEVTITHKDASVALLKRGIYRLDTDPAEVRVYDGEALVTLDGKQVRVKRGRIMPLEGQLVARKFDVKTGDSLSRWSRRRAATLAMANVSSARYINDRDILWARSSWVYNPYFGMYTYIPYRGFYTSPYGYTFWSPFVVYQAYRNPMIYAGGGGGNSGYRYDPNLGYSVSSAPRSNSSGAASWSPRWGGAPPGASGGSPSSSAGAPAASAPAGRTVDAAPRQSGAGGRGR